MLAYLPAYKDVLARHSIAAGEQSGESNNYDALMVNWKGTTSQADFIPALVTIIAVYAFYYWVGVFGTVQFSILFLLFPALVLLARRLRDMGKSPALVFVALIPLLVAFGVTFNYFSLGGLDIIISWISLAVTAALMAWGCAGQNNSAATA